MNNGSEQLVVLEPVTDGVQRIRLNRADKRNAMNRLARQQLLAALVEVKHRKTRVVVLAGSGVSFCAGIDLKERSTEIVEGQSVNGDSKAIDDDENSWQNVQEAIRQHPAVFIAEVNGFALGGGVTLINSCDLAVAANEASIGMPEVGFGMYPGLAGPSTQLRILRKRAAWLVLTAERINGVTAAEWGLVNLSVPLADLAAKTEEIATRIASFNPITLAWCKKALWEIPMHVSDWTSALEFGSYIGSQIRSQTDAVTTGLAAFATGTRTQGQGQIS